MIDQSRLRASSVSVVVPSFAGAARLPGLMECFMRQQTKRDWELIVVLDGTPDNSAEVLSKWTGSLPLEVIDLPRNVGRAAALNRGLERSSFDVLVRCDDDLLPSADYVERHGGWHDQECELGVIGLCRNVYGNTAFAAKYGRPVDRRYRREAYTRSDAELWRHWAGNCSIHRRSMERVGSYDSETFQGYGWEDDDYGYRLMCSGVRLILDPLLETDHLASAVTTSLRLSRAFVAGQAKARFAAKHRLEGLDTQLAGTWGFLVDRIARNRRPEWYLRTGARIDRILPYVGQRRGRQLVDLMLESASHAGYASIAR